MHLQKLKEVYSRNENLIQYMKNQSQTQANTTEQIMISYDFQAGTYMEGYYQDPSEYDQTAQRLAEIILAKSISGTVVEAGVGEASILVPLLNELDAHKKPYFQSVYGFDISWSRIKAAKAFAKAQGQDKIQFFMGDLLNIPIRDNSFDLVYTNHAIEPNYGREKEILEELYRVTRKYLILREPCYEFAGQEARARMKKHGYVTKLYQSAQELGYEIETYGLFHSSPEDRNPSGLMIIRKECSMEEEQERDGLFACPVSQKNMKKYENPMGEADYYCPESMLVYPIIQGVPCSTANNAVVATKYLEDFDQKANAEQKGRAKWQHTKKVINGNGGWWNYLKSAS